jgi:bacteriorhodopsin
MSVLLVLLVSINAIICALSAYTSRWPTFSVSAVVLFVCLLHLLDEILARLPQC